MLIDAKLMIDGKEIKTQIEIDEVDLKSIQNKKETGYERSVINHEYSFVDDEGKVHQEPDVDLEEDNLRFTTANYYSSIDVARDNARADQLMRQLRRFAIKNRREQIDWRNERRHKYNLYYSYPAQKIYIDFETSCKGFEIYFDSYEVAEQAIKKFKDELIWYFTEYKDSL